MTVYNYLLFLVSYCMESFLYTLLLVRMDNLDFCLLSFFSFIYFFLDLLKSQLHFVNVI